MSGVREGDGAGVSDARTGLRIMAECIERGLAMIGKEETEMLVKRQDAEDIRTVLVALETPLPTGPLSDEALRRGHDRDVIVTRERDESRARAARLEMALRGQATRLLPDGGVCYCDIQRSDECRNEPPCVEARAALASGESREGETK